MEKEEVCEKLENLSFCTFGQPGMSAEIHLRESILPQLGFCLFGPQNLHVYPVGRVPIHGSAAAVQRAPWQTIQPFSALLSMVKIGVKVQNESKVLVGIIRNF